MKSRIMTSMFGSAMTVLMMLAAIPPSPAQEGKTTNGVPVKMTVTVNVASDKRMPEINQQDVVVKQGKQRLQVAEWVPAQGDRAGLDLFILIDDASDTRLGSHLGDLRKFINAQPATTTVGVGYMRNATVQIAQNFTRDHAAAAKAVRLPLGTPGAYGSPYLSVIDLMQRWPESPNRREVVMVTAADRNGSGHAVGQQALAGRILGQLDLAVAGGDRFESDCARLGSRRAGWRADSARSSAGIARRRVCNLFGKLPIPEMYALYERVDAAVGSDSAPLHIAGAMGVPVLVGIYGPTGYRRTPPIGSPHIKLFSSEGELACQPCHKRTCPLGTDECMKRVRPEEVFQALLDGLTEAGIRFQSKGAAVVR